MVIDLAKEKELLITILDSFRDHAVITCTSGFFDPIHVGHIRNITETAKLGDLCVVIVNGDNQARIKKGKSFMPVAERAKIIDAIKGVDVVVIHDSTKDTTSVLPISVIQPNIFTKGGDRDSSKNVPEANVCEAINCKIVYNVGTGRVKESSSDYLAEWVTFKNSQNGSKV
jgi:D-beta-D-heptose 7-phosphate kinase/D-beta-D-heptose 1-phosphate adenosyltransferase